MPRTRKAKANFNRLAESTPRPLVVKKGRGHLPGQTGLGRPKGSRNQETINREQHLMEVMQHAVKILGDEIMSISPKDVMLLAMRTALQAGWVFRAAEIAADVAPYVHSKLQSVTVDSRNNDELRSDEDLQAELDEIRTRATASDRKGALEAPVSQKPEGMGDTGNVPGGVLSGEASRPTLQ